MPAGVEARTAPRSGAPGSSPSSPRPPELDALLQRAAPAPVVVGEELEADRREPPEAVDVDDPRLPLRVPQVEGRRERHVPRELPREREPRGRVGLAEDEHGARRDGDLAEGLAEGRGEARAVVAREAPRQPGGGVRLSTPAGPALLEGLPRRVEDVAARPERDDAVVLERGGRDEIETRIGGGVPGVGDDPLVDAEGLAVGEDETVLPDVDPAADDRPPGGARDLEPAPGGGQVGDVVADPHSRGGLDADVERERVEEGRLGPGRLGRSEDAREDLAVEVDVPLEKPAVERDGPGDPPLVLDHVERQLAREGRGESVGEAVPHVGEEGRQRRPAAPVPAAREEERAAVQEGLAARERSRPGRQLGLEERIADLGRPGEGPREARPLAVEEDVPLQRVGRARRAGVECDLARGRSPREERGEERRVGPAAGRDGDVREEAGERTRPGVRRGRGRPRRRRGTTSAPRRR